jgi:hypothetical protein
VVVSYTDDQGTGESVTSAEVGPISSSAPALAPPALNLTTGSFFVDIDATGIADGQS